jgi:hypothetical protein
VRFDAVLKLVINRPELQILLAVLERGVDLDELDPKSEPGASSPPCPAPGWGPVPTSSPQGGCSEQEQ